VAGHEQEAGHQQLLVQRQVRVLLAHGRGHGGAVHLVHDLQDLESR
jgi:hypothetical protein